MLSRVMRTPQGSRLNDLIPRRKFTESNHSIASTVKARRRPEALKTRTLSSCKTQRARTLRKPNTNDTRPLRVEKTVHNRKALKNQQRAQISTLSAFGNGSSAAGSTTSLTPSSPLIRTDRNGNITDTLDDGDRASQKLASKFYGAGWDFLYSAPTFYDHPINKQIPEVVILGASNVGKSYLLNALLSADGAARVSRRAGLTAMMNGFGVGPRLKISREDMTKMRRKPAHSLVLMDTPGYGHNSRTEWGENIFKYIKKRQALRGAVLLISSDKTQLQESDEWILNMLAETNTRTVVAITKADKLGKKWLDHCQTLSGNIRKVLQKVERVTESGRREDYGWHAHVLITAAALARSSRLEGNEGGIGGVRTTILEMIEFDPEEKAIHKINVKSTVD